MKRLSKITAALLCGVLLLNPMPTFAKNAAEVVTTSLSSDFDKVTAVVSLAEASNITSGIVSLDYDKEAVEVVDVKVNEEFADLVDFNEDELSLAWVSLEAENDAEDILTVEFKAVGATSGDQVKVTTNVKELYSEDELIAGDENYTSSCELKLLSVKAIKNQVYTGKKITPSVAVFYGDKKLKKGTDYTVSYENNKDAGIAKVIITGKGEFKGRNTEASFVIEPKKVTSMNSKATVYAGFITLGGDGIEVNGVLTVDGKIIWDGYTVSITDQDGNVVSDNVVTESGQYTLTITCEGNYEGSVSKSFKATKTEIRIMGHLLATTWIVK